MKPQLDKIRAEAAFDRDKCFEHLEPMVCYDRTREDGKPYRVKVSDQSTSVDLAMLENARLTRIIEKLLRVIECQDAALTTACEEMNLATVRFNRGDINGKYFGEQLDDGLKEVREARAEVLRILEGS